MCNLSEAIEERGIEKGIEKGIHAMIEENMEEQVPKERILKKLERHFSLTREAAEKYYQDFTA